MKIFFVSYIISLCVLSYPFYQDIMARPFDILPRLAIYLAFPLAMFISIVIVLLGSYFGVQDSKEQIVQPTSHVPPKSGGREKNRAA